MSYEKPALETIRLVCGLCGDCLLYWNDGDTMTEPTHTQKIRLGNQHAKAHTGNNPAYGVQHHETIKPRAVKPDDGVNVAQIWIGLAIGLFFLLTWAAIQLAPLMR